MREIDCLGMGADGAAAADVVVVVAEVFVAEAGAAAAVAIGEDVSALEAARDGDGRLKIGCGHRGTPPGVLWG